MRHKIINADPNSSPLRFVVKFQDSFDLPYNEIQEVQSYFLKNNIIHWEQLVREVPGIKIDRLYTSLSVGEIKSLVRSVIELNPNYKAPNFLSCFAIDFPCGVYREDLLSTV